MNGLPCSCSVKSHVAKLIVLTGGPGAGKTAALELARKHFCEHVTILPEAASIVFGGGFWRHDTLEGRKAAQRAIFHVQREQERMVLEEGLSAVVLCDRGTLDGLAYWPGEPHSYWSETGAIQAEELTRYSAVIHLRTPSLQHGYNNSNPVRTETAIQAAQVDERILAAWQGHPHRFAVASTSDFLSKAQKTLEIIRSQLPECCRSHPLPGESNEKK
jgi:predicted ATPase